VGAPLVAGGYNTAAANHRLAETFLSNYHFTGYEPGVTLCPCLWHKLLSARLAKKFTYNDVVMRLRDSLDDYPALLDGPLELFPREA
jgi:hypothetical protein